MRYVNKVTKWNLFVMPKPKHTSRSQNNAINQSQTSELLDTKFVLRGSICNKCNVNSRDRFWNSVLRFLLRKNTYDICQGFWTGCCPMCIKWFSPTVKKQNVKDVIFVISPTYSAASSSSSSSSTSKKLPFICEIQLQKKKRGKKCGGPKVRPFYVKLKAHRVT